MAKKKKTKVKAGKAKPAKKPGKKSAKKKGKTTAKKAAKKITKKAAKKAAKKTAKKTAKKAAKKTAKKAAKKAKTPAKLAKKPGKAPKTAKKPRRASAAVASSGFEHGGEHETLADTFSSELPSDDEEGSGQAPTTGDDAPNFALPVLNGEGETWSLDDVQGEKNVVLYFYPKDDTPGCTLEACAFQQDLSSFDEHDAIVVGVSGDSLESHRKFAAKHQLSFPLLSDGDHAVAKAYGVWVKKNMYGRESMGIQRSTFLINKHGQIARAWHKVKVDGHSTEVLQALQSL